jgi:hypothetical protein
MVSPGAACQLPARSTGHWVTRLAAAFLAGALEMQRQAHLAPPVQAPRVEADGLGEPARDPLLSTTVSKLAVLTDRGRNTTRQPGYATPVRHQPIVLNGLALLVGRRVRHAGVIATIRKLSGDRIVRHPRGEKPIASQATQRWLP